MAPPHSCGNTLNCNHPVVRSLILDCLRHWVIDLQIDGVRFDLAAVPGRGGHGLAGEIHERHMGIPVAQCGYSSMSWRTSSLN